MMDSADHPAPACRVGGIPLGSRVNVISLILIITLTLCFLVSSGNVHASDGDETSTAIKNQAPLWEAGVMGLGFTLPHYIGSDEYFTYAVPVPYFFYRGEYITASRGGIRGRFFRSDRFETDISIGGNLPVASNDNEARRDMPGLDSLLEIGPAIRYYLLRSRNLDYFYLQAALRGAVSFSFNGGLDIGVDYRGYRYTLDLKYLNQSLLNDFNTSLTLSAGVSYADDLLNGYFYSVDPEFETSDRASYDADAGYAGLYLSGAFEKVFSERWSLGGTVGWRNLNGAVFEASPLVRTTNNYYASIYLIWKFARSSVMVSGGKSQAR